MVGFSDDWFAQRRFPVDMAGFAINVAFMKARNPKADQAMPYKAGYEEDKFLSNLNITIGEIEPMANGCRQVLVWHTRTVKDKTAFLRTGRREAVGTNLPGLLGYLTFSGMATAGPGGREMKACLDLRQCNT